MKDTNYLRILKKSKSVINKLLKMDTHYRLKLKH